MIGMNCEIKKNVLPFITIYNKTEKVLKLNEIGFKRKYQGNLTVQDIQNYKKYIKKNKSLPENLGNELNKILEPFENSHNGFYC
jgi:acyl-[acyl carrier protein]--UDP-N-acetylglucosamine O-acyltransferase